MKCSNLIRYVAGVRARAADKTIQLAFAVLTSLMSMPAFAGSDTTFSSMVDWVQDKLTGSMGALIAIVALLIAIISSLMGKFTAFLIVLVVVVAGTLGGAIVVGLFTAVF
ncbi:TrbC/VirB2 family protein [Neisseria sp. CCUG12390]|uniref:TrbC/VirB2 family protein n=1 Tax=Neisseria sp. CCUG12390 TaxID=3392035 RepID=UPI003A0FC397